MRNALAIALVLFALVARGAGLGALDRGYVDGMRLEPGSGTVTLVLLIDRPLEDGLTKQSAKRKLLAYREWLQSPAFSSTFPEAKPEKGVFVIILHRPARTALGRSVLEQLEGYARELGFRPNSQLIQARERGQS